MSLPCQYVTYIFFRWQHAEAVKAVVSVPEINAVISGSWDKTYKVWDCRTPEAQTTVSLPNKCIAMDLKWPYLAVVMSGQRVQIFDLQKSGTIFKVPIVYFEGGSFSNFFLTGLPRPDYGEGVQGHCPLS